MTKMHSGLVSVTFRRLSPREIVALVTQAGLEAIEWGGDVHVPHGDLLRAEEVRVMTDDAGLAVASYGSYFAAGDPERRVEFGRALDTALKLGAPVIRVWAGREGSAEAGESGRGRVEDELRRACEAARPAGLTVACEYHPDTLTDTCESALRLMRDVGNGIKCYWQPRPGSDVESSVQDLRQLAPFLSNIHVYQWKDHNRHPLAEGTHAWMEYFRAIAEAGGERHVLLEFVREDSPEQFLRDARVLKEMLDSLDQ